jgi:hypothetical protein
MEWFVVWKSVTVLYLVVVTICKWLINPITNPNPVFSHWNTWQYIIFFRNYVSFIYSLIMTMKWIHVITFYALTCFLMRQSSVIQVSAIFTYHCYLLKETPKFECHFFELECLDLIHAERVSRSNTTSITRPLHFHDSSTVNFSLTYAYFVIRFSVCWNHM